jgi:hypothetical protein
MLRNLEFAEKKSFFTALGDGLPTNKNTCKTAGIFLPGGSDGIRTRGLGLDRAAC